MREPNKQVMRLLEKLHPDTFTASQIVRYTGLSFSTVRASLNVARERGYVERNLDIGLNGHTIYQWYFRGDGTQVTS